MGNFKEHCIRLFNRINYKSRCSVICLLLLVLVLVLVLLMDLKSDRSNEVNGQEDRYQETVGCLDNFSLHTAISILSFLIFGLRLPVFYGFSFWKSDDRDLKLAAVCGPSFVCIILLAIGKAHIQRKLPKHTSARYCTFLALA